MTDEPQRKNTKIIVLAMVMIAFAVTTPIVYGVSAVWALSQLQFGFPTLNVTFHDFSVDVVFSLPVTNPTLIPLPLLTMLIDIELDQAVLFRQQTKTIGTLDGQSTAIVQFEMTLNLGTALVLWNSLTSYVQGIPVNYAFHCQLSVHVISDFQVYNVSRAGSVHI